MVGVVAAAAGFLVRLRRSYGSKVHWQRVGLAICCHFSLAGDVSASANCGRIFKRRVWWMKRRHA